jgi:hypothetical protein
LVDFEWNIDLDPKLFDPASPQGYTDVTPKSPASEKQVLKITEALKTYAEASGGRYPREIRDEGGLAAGSDLYHLLGVYDKVSLYPTEADLRADGNIGKATRALSGFEHLGRILAHNPDAAYFGATVGPKEKNKVLLRWKLADGRYEVIFGDLQAETVTAKQLRVLEGKE